MAERVLIVDDHPLTRDALAALLRQEGFDVVGTAEDGGSAVAVAEEHQPDLVLLDLTMPGLDGLAALPRIREQSPGSEVVVLTASDAEENLLAAIRAGASGYLLKTEPPEQIATFLRSVARGDAALSGGVARRLLDRVRDGGRPTASRRRSRVCSPRARSRSCCSSTSTSAPTRSRSGCSSPSTPCARTSRISSRSSASRPGARRSSGSSRPESARAA